MWTANQLDPIDQLPYTGNGIGQSPFPEDLYSSLAHTVEADGMDPCTIVEKLPSAAEYNRLRQSVGWGAYQEEVIDRSLPHSLYCLRACKDDQVVGMARIIRDAGMVYYIQDVIVRPKYQRQGIGTQLMDRIMDYVRAHANHNSIIGLMSAKGKEPFYERYGFTRRPTDSLGCGMTTFWSVE